jgi:hypothetical protein
MTLVFVGEDVEQFWVLASGKKKFRFVTQNVHGLLGMTHDVFDDLLLRFRSEKEAEDDVFDDLLLRFRSEKEAEDFAARNFAGASKAVAASVPRLLKVKLL